MSDKWAIMICLNEQEDDWIYVTEDTGKCDWILQPLLFDDVREALDASEAFIIPGKENNVTVVNYEG